MENETVLMGRFQDVGLAAETLEKLRDVGLSDDAVEVISGYPFSPEMLGRPHRKTILPYISMGSAVVGFVAGTLYDRGHAQPLRGATSAGNRWCRALPLFCSNLNSR